MSNFLPEIVVVSFNYVNSWTKHQSPLKKDWFFPMSRSLHVRKETVVRNFVVKGIFYCRKQLHFKFLRHKLAIHKKKMIRRLISGFKAWGEWALIWISFLNLLLHNSSIHKTFDLQVCNYSLACIRGQMALIVCLFVNFFFF